MKRTHILWLIVALLLLLPGGHALAAPAGGETPGTGQASKGSRVAVELPPQDLTYTESASKEQRDQGRRLFKKGNEAFEQRAVDNAYKYYTAAYKLWPHPRVLFNIAVSLGFLSRPLESARTFRKVLRYGPEPITKHRYKQASERYIELMGQLTNLIVTCTDAGAKLFIDGRSIGSAPMKKKVTLGPGTHMVTASLAGKVPYSAQVRLEPGELKSIAVALEAFSDRVRWRSVSRFHWWVPTLVTVAAAVLAGGGGAMLGWGRNDVGKLQQEVNVITQANPEVPFTYDTNREDTAVTLQKAGFAMLGLAGTAAVAAVVLWILRKKKVRYTVGEAGTGGVKIRF